MLEFNVTLDMFPNLLSKLPKISLELQPLAIDTNDYDSAPINLQTPLNNTAADGGTIPFSNTMFSPQTPTDLLVNFTLFGNYNNLTVPAHRHQIYSYETCSDAYLSNTMEHLDDARLEFWVCGIVLNIVGILGIIGNIIAIIILSRPQMRSSINYLLIGLALCDTVLILTSILLFGIPSIYPHSGHFFLYYNHIYPFITPAVFPIGMIAQTASIYMTFTVTLERYVTVCHSSKARALCTYRLAKIYFIVCVIFSLLYNLPRFWEVRTVSYLPEGTTILLHCVRPSLMRRNLAYINIYIHWSYLIINYIIPFLTMAILNFLIYRQVKHMNRELHCVSRSEKRAIALATMLLYLVIIFFMLNSLALVINFSETFYNSISHSLTKISNLLITINSSANFLIYMIFGEKFRHIFLLIFQRRFRHDQPDLIHYDSSISNNSDGTINHRIGSGWLPRRGTRCSTTTTTYFSSSSVQNIRNFVELSHIVSADVVQIKSSIDGVEAKSNEITSGV